MEQGLVESNRASSDSRMSVSATCSKHGALPAVIEIERTVSNQAQIPFRGNRYSLLPGHAGEVVTVRHKLGSTTLEVTDRHGATLAHHVRQPDGAGAVVRLDEHVAALTKVV